MRAGLSALTLLGLALLAASLLPSSMLTGRLLGAAGQTGGGVFTQELVAHLSDRLRFSGALILALAAGLTVTRSATHELFVDARCQARGLYGALTSASRSVSVMTLVLVGMPTLVGLALRLVFINQPIRYDEALTFNEFASRPLYYGLSFYPDPNNHLLNTLLAHMGYVLFGNHLWVVRLPALVAGVSLVPASYALGQLWFGSGAGLLSSAIVAVSSYLVGYSTNGRGYTLQALSFVVVLALAVLAVRRDSPGLLLVAAVVAALGAYAVPTMLYGVAVVAIWLAVELWRGRPKRIRGAHLVASALILGAVVAVLYLPVMIVSGPDKIVSNRFVVPLGIDELMNELPRSLANTFAFWNRDLPLLLAVLLVIGFAIASWRQPIGLVAALTCLVLVLVQRVAPFERVWIFLLPLYFVVASGGLTRFVDGRLLALVFGGAIGFFTLTSGSILASTETGAFPDAEAVTRTLSSQLVADDAVMTAVPASLPELQYYFPRYGLPISTLVKTPEEANRLWVITPSTMMPQVTGWSNQTEVAEFESSRLFELTR